jgi:hypothetical protein
MAKILPLRSQLALHTRCENQIANEIDREPVRFGDTLRVEDFRKEYPHEVHRPVSPSRKYNCHGLCFAGRRTWIDDSQEIAKIIEDDEYQKVPYAEVQPGDVAIYYVDGDAEHSGIVVSLDDLKVPSVLSKWGPFHEVVHKVARCPYDAQNVVYYRIKT